MRAHGRDRRRVTTMFCLRSFAAALIFLHAAASWPASSDFAEAARTGDLAAIRALLEDGSAAALDVDAPAPDGMTALLWAAQANDVELVRNLLDAGADPNHTSRYGIAPLWLAATNRSAPLVELLLARGANARAAMPHGETALMAAARAGDAASIRLLLDAGADPNASESAHGETALMWAAGEDHADAIRALVAGGADPDAHSTELDLPAMRWEQTGMVSTILPVGGWTALMYAARQDAQTAALALAESGADLDAQDPDGTTALGLAIMNAHYDLAALLLEAGADPDVADRTGMTALYGAVDMVTLGPVIALPERPRLDRLTAIDLVRLALVHGANPNAQLASPIIGRHHGFADRELGEGATALMRAAKGGDVESMRLLLDAGADPSLTLTDGSNVLFFLVEASNDEESSAAREALRLVLEAGADVGAVGRNGETALHRAARQSNAVAVTMLVEHGARLDARDGQGRTPLDVASEAPAPNEGIGALLRRLAGQPSDGGPAD